MEIIRALPIYFQDKKIAEVTRGSYEIDSGDELLVGICEGALGPSEGPTTVRLLATCIVPIYGLRSKVDVVIVTKQPVQLGIPFGNVFHGFSARLKTAKYEWESKSGSCIGAIEFFGWNLELSGSG